MSSEVLTDDDFSGGRITAIEILNGVINQFFTGSSRLDRTLGRVSLRKGFLAVQTALNETYFGSHVIISEPQLDPGIDLLIMTTNSDFDTRSQAQEIIQSPIDVNNTSDSSWAIDRVIVGASNKAVMRPAITYIADTFPEFDNGLLIKLASNNYTISSIQSNNFPEMKITLTTALVTNLAIDDAVYDEIGDTRWGMERSAAIGDTVIYIKHVTYKPGLNDTVIISGGAFSVSAIDSTDWTQPVYTFSDNFKNPEAAVADIMKLLKYNANTNEYYGVTKLSTDALVDATSIFVSALDKFIFPLGSENVDPKLIGLDSKALPPGKKVDIITLSDVIVIHSTTQEAIANPSLASTTYSLTGTDYQLVELLDQDDVPVNPDLYTVDLTTSSVTMAAAIDLSPYNQPLVAHKRHEDMRLVTGVNKATNEITLGRPLSQPFLAANTQVSSALIYGDLKSTYINLFDQLTWTSVWQDTPIGNSASATYNDIDYPIVISNEGAITENWALVFDGTTTFDIIGENVGQIGTGQTDAAGGTFVAPINSKTSLPYFKVPQEGWGGGWSIGNVLRFKTIAANKPIWFIRTTQQGDNTIDPTDKFTIQIRGDIS